MMKKLLFALIFCCFAITKLSASDSIYVYKTYQNYKQGTGDFYNYYGGWMHVMGKMSISVSNGNTKAKIKAKDVWGFMYNGYLFRSDARTGQFACLVSKGKICYYENGFAYLSIIRGGEGSYSQGYACYVSKNLKTALAPFPSTPISDAKKLIKTFRKENPKYEALFVAIGNNYNYLWVRKKVQEFEDAEASE